MLGIYLNVSKCSFISLKQGLTHLGWTLSSPITFSQVFTLFFLYCEIFSN